MQVLHSYIYREIRILTLKGVRNGFGDSFCRTM